MSSLHYLAEKIEGRHRLFNIKSIIKERASRAYNPSDDYIIFPGQVSCSWNFAIDPPNVLLHLMRSGLYSSFTYDSSIDEYTEKMGRLQCFSDSYHVVTITDVEPIRNESVKSSASATATRSATRSTGPRKTKRNRKKKRATMREEPEKEKAKYDPEEYLNAEHGYNIKFKNSWGKDWNPPDGTFTITPKNQVGFLCFDEKIKGISRVRFISMCMVERKMRYTLIHRHEVKHYTEYIGTGYVHPTTGVFIYHGEGEFFSYHHGPTRRKVLDHYQGKFRHGYFHGHGYFKTGEGTYEGSFYYGSRHGKGKIQHHNESQGEYEGDFQYDLKHGKGTYKSANVTFSGNFANNALNGMASMTMVYSKERQKTYTGIFNNGRIAEGPGVITFQHQPNRSIKGRFNGNLDLNGRYVYTAENGNVYTGAYSNDKKMGGGHIQFVNGDQFRGVFYFDKLYGNGIYTTAGEDQYIGDFEGSLDIDCTDGSSGNEPVKVELEEIRYKNGDICTGRFKGIFELDCKTQRVTLTVNSGKGVLKTVNGEEDEGEFKNNKFIPEFTKVVRKKSKTVKLRK
jgi:hypothetical protein